MPKGSKVLMADDDKMLLDMYKERLELAGYNVESYGNGEEALAHIRDFTPDIIMLDVMMPKMNGYETLASIKSDPVTKNIPVVMLSALMRDFNREKAVEGGAEDYLIKSEAMPSDVITKIEQVLQKYGQSSAPVVASPNKVVFEPAAAEVVAPQSSAPVSGQSSINTQPEITTPKMTEIPTIDTPSSKVEVKENPKSGGWIGPVIVVILILVVAILVYYFLVINK